ncbi:MAG: ribonuclease Z [Spirochaetales bacterium]|nr:ribonuclease Z [Spirochaetales bacterium]
MIFELTILGSSSALPTSQRYPSAHVLNAHERFFLIDCGEGTQMQLRKYRIKYGKIHHIFISHLHGDHVFGLYGLLSSLNLTGRLSPLRIYAPAGYGEILNSHLSDFDIHLNFDIDFIPLKGKDPVKIFENKGIRVYSLPLKHRVPAFVFLFREKEKERNIIREAIRKYNIPLSEIHKVKKGADFYTDDGKCIPNSEITRDPPQPRSFAYCSDTLYFPRMAEFVRGVNLLYHEATFASDREDLALRTGHSTAGQAANIARDAGVGRLVIGHFSARYRDVAPLVEEAREIFSNTIPAQEGSVITI